ncbi:DUF6186 family protein [Aciditerrimonas ferrireducens]|uniref:DUF6186 family protein n=1 Tax=Aciditerrimonas ferrireducens TaxID=667306 RepID=A0ABV6C160_9ACTN|nr:DUF6186 family protein [Aciditerrimonas ferrireducens]MCK4176324.1 DUF6186 family protein [Aciditerrimonas ferrireducens]
MLVTIALDALWAALAAGLVGLVVASHLPRPVDRPAPLVQPFGQLVRRAVERPWARGLLLLGWLWLGWHFFAR